MKNLLLAGIVACATVSLAAKELDYTFSLKNNTQRTIFLKIEPSDFMMHHRSMGITGRVIDITTDKERLLHRINYVLGKPVHFGPNRSFALALPTVDDKKNNEVYRLEISYANAQGKSQNMRFLFDFGAIKNFHVKLQEKNGVITLVPQKGEFFGKTTSGFKMSKNVQMKDLNPIGIPKATFSVEDAEDLD